MVADYFYKTKHSLSRGEGHKTVLIWIFTQKNSCQFFGPFWIFELLILAAEIEAVSCQVCSAPIGQ